MAAKLRATNAREWHTSMSQISVEKGVLEGLFLLHLPRRSSNEARVGLPQEQHRTREIQPGSKPKHSLIPSDVMLV